MKSEEAKFKFREKNRRRKEERDSLVAEHGEVRGLRELKEARRLRRSYLNGAFGRKTKDSE
jgi:hypothetical protein